MIQNNLFVPRWDGFSDCFPVALPMTSKTSKKFKFLPRLPSTNASTFLHFQFLFFGRNRKLWFGILLFFPGNADAILENMGFRVNTVVGVVRCCRVLTGEVFVSLLNFEAFSNLATGRTSSSSSIYHWIGIIFLSIALVLLTASQSCERTTMRTRWSNIHGRKWESMSMNVFWNVSGMQVLWVVPLRCFDELWAKEGKQTWERSSGTTATKKKKVAEHHNTDFWMREIKNRFFFSSTIPCSALATTTVTSDTWIKWFNFGFESCFSKKW